MENSTNSLLKQLSSLRGNHIIQQCATLIEDLQKELQQQVKINQEQKHLIAILQEGKEYYQQQYRNNSYQQQCQQLTSEITRLTALANAHRKVSLQLKDTVQQLHQEINHLHSQLAQKDALLQESQMMTIQLKGEKEILEKEWNKAIKAVKRKIATIVSQQQDNAQSNKENIPINRNSIKKTPQEDITHKPTEQSVQYSSRGTLMERAKKMVAQLEKEEAIEELENIFNSKSEASNSKHTYRGQILKENNQHSILFNSGYH